MYSKASEIYRELTGVDIAHEEAKWDERGKGYYGEYLVFKQLYPNIKGCCKILMNLQIPTATGSTTEIDLLLIHETGLYVFEIKHYKGTIYGTDTQPKWTQYFRTAPNVSFRNPVLQNQYHIESLRLLFPDIPIYSYVVFTNPDCDLRVTCSNPDISICLLQNLRYSMDVLNKREAIFDIEYIDSVFNWLLPYCPTMSKTVSIDDHAVPFHEYINTIICDYRTANENLEKSSKKQRIAGIIYTVLCALICIVTCFLFQQFANTQIQDAQEELSNFAKKFEYVQPYNNGSITMEKGFISTSDVYIQKSIDVKNAVNLRFTLNWNGEYYGACINKDTKIIVLLKDGSVKEYSLPDDVYPYATKEIRFGASNAWYINHTKYEFPVIELAALDIADIAYIKLSNLSIWVTKSGSYKPITIGTGYEVRIY